MFFYELLQVAIGNTKKLSQTPTEEEWRELYVMSQKQAMVGIAFRGVELLPENQRPPKALLIQWYMDAENIKVMNAELDEKALYVANMFLGEGFPSVILKGQGIARLYNVERNEKTKSRVGDDYLVIDKNENLHIDSEPSSLIPQLSSYRAPGDIDIWLSGTRGEILSYVRTKVSDCKPVYHHVDFSAIEGIGIEVHFTPSWMNSLLTNRRLQRWFQSFNFQCSIHDYTELPVPNLDFNRVYILIHIYRHLFGEGIGMRQLLDYYFVLCQGFTSEEREEAMRTLRSLKMERFAKAVMWVLQEVFGMGDNYLLTEPDEHDGRFLLNEIMLAGNFGQHDERLQYERGETSIHRALRKIKRNFRFIGSYPSEALWSPIWKIWHWCWRKTKGYL